MPAFKPLDAYAGGLMGCRPNPRADEEFADSIIRHGGNPDGGSVAWEWELQDAGKGKLTLLFPAVEKALGPVFPGPPQVVGDCVARGGLFAYITSLGMEVASGKPDEVTGRVEGAPEVPPEGVKTGVASSISIWAWRGYESDGWYCAAAAQVITEKGVLLCKPYPELGIDLTTYGKHNIGIGGKSVPKADKWLAESKPHIARTATILKGREQVRDFLAAGYGIFNCSSMAFERTRDAEWGYSRQVGVWHHSQSFLGYDDRPETHARWGQALVLWNNGSWGKWNTGTRKIKGTDIEIPHGTFWCLASTIDRCQCIALSSVAGWPKRQHTTYGAEGHI